MGHRRLLLGSSQAAREMEDPLSDCPPKIALQDHNDANVEDHDVSSPFQNSEKAHGHTDSMMGHHAEVTNALGCMEIAGADEVGENLHTSPPNRRMINMQESGGKERSVMAGELPDNASKGQATPDRIAFTAPHIPLLQHSDGDPHDNDTLLYEKAGPLALIQDDGGREYVIQLVRASLGSSVSTPCQGGTPSDSDRSLRMGSRSSSLDDIYRLHKVSVEGRDASSAARSRPTSSENMVRPGSRNGTPSRSSAGNLTTVYLNAMDSKATANASHDHSPHNQRTSPEAKNTRAVHGQTDPPLEHWYIDFDELKFLDRIGRGAYSEVYRGMYRETDVAIKMIHGDITIAEESLAAFEKEVNILRRIRHPNVLQFMGACRQPPYLCIVSEFEPNGSLFKILHQKDTPLSLSDKVKLAMGTAVGMHYLHQNKPTIVHGDLKSANILVRSDLHVRICDFGLSRVNESTARFASPKFGTVEWCAPEILQGLPSNKASDVYSYGVVLWEIFSRQLPWAEYNRLNTMIAVGFRNEILPIPRDIPVWAQGLISDCFQARDLRPSFQSIISRLRHISAEVCAPFKG